jgi:hypothetical protein
MSISLLRQLLMKEAVKKSAGSSGIMSINKNIAADVDKLLQKYINDAMQQGVDLDTLSPEQLKMIVAINSKPTNRVISGSSTEGKAITEKLFGKKGEVVEFPQKRSFKEEIDAMKKSGDLVDEDNMVISEKITDREMFKNSNLNKPTIEGQMEKINNANKRLGEILKEQEAMYKPKVDTVEETVTYIKTLEPMTALKEANLVIGRKGKYKDLTPEQSKKILQDTEDHIFERDIPDEDFAKGGRAGFYTGGMIDVEPNLSDIGHGSDSLMARTRLVSPDGQATTSTGLNYLLAEDNDNIRVPFKGGGLTPEDYLKVKDMLDHYHDYKKGGGTMSKKNFGIAFFRENNAEGGRIGFSAGGGGRRAFLKFLASIGGLTAAAKSGMIGLGEGTTKKAVTETVKQSAGSGTPPPYFFKLVEKIKTMGDDVTKKAATQEREVVTRYKDFELTENIATGEKTIQRIKTDTDAMYYDETLAEDVYMNYKPGKGQADETTKGIPADEYVEDTSYLRTSGPQKGEIFDTVDGVPDEVIQEGTMFEDTMTEFGKTKKADGGRIGFRVGGSGKKFLEKIFGKEAMKEMPNRDPEMYQGMLEVVDMFRAKDKEGLKIYLQKFLPHMDDETIEAFIVGDAVDAAGQGKYGLGNIQGQLIRLGSGRDYAGKIEAFKRLERNKALKDLEVTKDMQRKPNASGGLQNMLGE